MGWDAVPVKIQEGWVLSDQRKQDQFKTWKGEDDEQELFWFRRCSVDAPLLHGPDLPDHGLRREVN
jgi:hypothetical protein